MFGVSSLMRGAGIEKSPQKIAFFANLLRGAVVIAVDMILKNDNFESFSSSDHSLEGAMAISLREVFDEVRKSVPFEIAWVVTTLPRSGLQIAQPQRVPEGLLRAYVRDYHRYDYPTWQAVLKQTVLTSSDLWGNGDSSHPYLREFMKPAGLSYVAVLPLESPIFPGYVGAMHLYRTSEQGPFTEAERTTLGATADALNRQNAEQRPQDNSAPWYRSQQARQFIFDRTGRQLLPGSDLNAVDDVLRQQMVDRVNDLIERGESSSAAGDRVSLADARGDLWNFHVAKFDKYPALSDGPVVFFCNIPHGEEWSTIRPGDLHADPELARMVPAMQFMQQEFRRVPTLAEIARTVHLSPFHFHRRFTELMGLTPKHFLLDCQIEQAKQELAAGQKELAAIASECGFAHQSHFTSRFKQATGLTPTRWRRAVVHNGN